MTGPTAPLPSAPTPYPAGAPMPPPPPGPYGGYAPPPPRRRSRIWIIIAVVVVVLLVVAVGAYLLVPAAPQIQVVDLLVWAPDNVCGLNVSQIYYDGYNTSTGSSVSLELTVPNFNTTACTIASATTNTTGFSLSGVQVPLSIPGSGNGSMNLTIASPSSAFSGNVNLVFA